MMNKYKGLLQKIADELKIIKGNEEPEISYKMRIIYSAIGHLALAALFDKSEEQENQAKKGVSDQHIKNRIKSLYDSYTKMYPELAESLRTCSADGFAEEIFSVYLNTGHMYKVPNRVMPSVFVYSSEQSEDKVYFLRGAPIWQKVYRSGLGAWHKNLNNSTSISFDSAASMFNLQRTELKRIWRYLIKRKFAPIIDGIGGECEYLKLKAPFKAGYFQNKPCEEQSRVSLMRNKDKSLYYLYRYKDVILSAAQLPVRQTENCEYRTIANCCLWAAGTLPPSEYRVDGEIVYLDIKYLYPPAEMNFIRLYSWPYDYNYAEKYGFNQFKRIMSLSVFKAVKSVLTAMGYVFEEIR